MIKIFSDSQAGIRAVGNPQRPSGQYFLRSIYQHTRDLQELGSKLIIQWVPAHVSLQGNEEADHEAKLAALQGLNRGQKKVFSAGQPGETMIRLPSAARRQVRQRINKR